MKFNVLMLSLTACLAFAATADAQPGGGGGGRGGRGGPGGGMGMMGGRGGGSIFRLVQNENVQKELALSTDQVASVKEVTEDYRDAVGQFPGGRDMSADERRAAMDKFQETSKAKAEVYLPKLKAALTSDQFTRLQQIQWQSQGVSALSDPELVKALALTQQQQDKIKGINADTDAKRDELFAAGRQGGGGGGREAFQANMEKMQELGKDRETKINGVLTKDQVDKFASLKGKEFDLASLRGGGPGGGGPGGGGGGGGNGGRQKRPQSKDE